MGEQRLRFILPTVILRAFILHAVLLLVVERGGWPQQRAWSPHVEA